MNTAIATRLQPGQNTNTKTYLIPLLISFLLLALTSCGQNKLVNRWTAAGHLFRGKLEAEHNDGREFEFLKNGTLKIYEHGKVNSTATYTMAADAKSIEVAEGRQSGTIKIMKLTTGELILIFNNGGDTILFYPSGSAASKQAQSSAEGYSQLQVRMNDFYLAYRRRLEVISNLRGMYLALGNTKNEIIASLKTTEAEIEAFWFDARIPSKDGYIQYITLQEKYSKDIPRFLEALKKDSKMMETETYKVGMQSLQLYEKDIEKFKAEFITAFNKYHGKQIL